MGSGWNHLEVRGDISQDILLWGISQDTPKQKRDVMEVAKVKGMK